MASRKPADPHQQTLCLIWESELVRAGDNTVQVVAKKPLSRVTCKRAAEILGCSEWTVNKLHREGLIEGYKPGAVKVRTDGRASNARLVLDAGSVLAYKQKCQMAE